MVAYQVSGEYAMWKLAAQEGLLDPRAALLETWIAMRRAGARLIVTYAAREAAQLGWLP
jgi:porphobilinogen synthase